MTAGKGKALRAYILTAFGCPFAGKVDPETVVQVAIKLSHLGVKEISLLDSTGMANPIQVKSLVKAILDLNLPSKLAVHFHNTRNSAMANCIAAYEAGVRIFDSAISGLSLPLFGSFESDLGFWNVPTEDLVNLFEEMGIDTGIDMAPLLKCVEAAERLAKRPLHGHLLRTKAFSKYQKVYNNSDRYLHL
jgi:hydroxymethylglutaryl-CoA lyase